MDWSKLWLEELEEEARFAKNAGKSIGGLVAVRLAMSFLWKEKPRGGLFLALLWRCHCAPQETWKSCASNIALDVIFSIITCGIYWFFWQARQMRALNHLLKEQRFNFLLWFLVSIITCFLFNVYYEYIMAQAVVEIQKRDGREPSNDLPVLSLVLSILGSMLLPTRSSRMR